MPNSYLSTLPLNLPAFVSFAGWVRAAAFFSGRLLGCIILLCLAQGQPFGDQPPNHLVQGQVDDGQLPWTPSTALPWLCLATRSKG